jgi:hypothetical protein
MKLAVAALLVAPAVAFSGASFSVKRTALHMSTEAAEETKVSGKFMSRKSIAFIESYLTWNVLPTLVYSTATLLLWNYVEFIRKTYVQCKRLSLRCLPL